MAKKRRNILKMLDQSKPTKVLGILKRAREKYVERWSQDSAAFAADGHYSWMCNFLDGFDRILEVGCGDGRSTLELARKKHSIISIDENPTSLELTSERLAKNGFASKVIYRGTQKGTMGSYEIAYAPFDVQLTAGQILLVESDLFVDQYLEGWLLSVDPIDAVACWLIGTYQGRGGQYSYAKVRSSGDYRLTIQNRLYELADKILRPGGRLHIVDRGEEHVSDDLVNDHIDAHADQASVTSLKVSPDVESRPYKPIGGVDTVLTPGLSGRVPKTMNPALISVFSEKPQ